MSNLVRIRSLFLVLGLWMAVTGSAVAQGETMHRKEFDYGINFNTRGGFLGGLMIKSATLQKEDLYRFWALEIVEVKHPKENRYASQETGDIYIYGKSNYLFAIRPQVGLEKVFFRKAPESGVQVNGIIAGGPSVGLLVPYYIYYNYAPMDANDRFTGPNDIRTEQYNPDIHNNKFSRRIWGKAGFLQGISDATPKLGAHLKIGASFEYGRYWENVTGIETGFMFEAFSDRLILFPQADNDKFFSSVYLTIYYGRRR